MPTKTLISVLMLVCAQTAGFCIGSAIAASASRDRDNSASTSRNRDSSYPNKPIRWIEPFPPGAGTDVLARAVALKLADVLGNPVVVDNRLGAAGNIAVDAVAKATPDGYTIGTVSATHAVNPSVYPNIPYDLLRDMQPIIQLSAQAYTLVSHPALPAANVQQLIAQAKAKPRQINYGSAGVGTLSHLAGALLEMLARVEMAHIPYKGGPPALIDLMSGEIKILFVTSFVSDPHVKANRLRMLGVSSVIRMRSLPDVPTIAESGVPGFDVTGWYGVVAPAQVPQPIIDRLNREIARILQAPEIKNRMAAEGAEPMGASPAAFRTHLQNEVEKWRKVVKTANIRVE